jgi:DNA-binding IclR family transcriptional regulator
MNQLSRSAVDQPGSGQGVQVERALDVLEWLAAAGGQGRGLSEIALAMGQPKATMHRLLTVLRKRGYIAQDEQSGYQLGIKCFELGNDWAKSFDLRTFARPFLVELNEELGETVHLAVYDQGDVVYVDKLESTHIVIARPDIGNRAPATVVATGRSLLAFQPAGEIRAQLSRPLPAYTETTPTTAEDVAKVLEQVRRDGFAVNQETYRKGICGLAAPIRDSTGGVIASVGILVPAHRFLAEEFDTHRDATIRTALAISTALGGPAQLITAAR